MDIYKSIDLDGNGELTRDEFVGKALAGADADGVFDKLDANGDGRVTASEWFNYWFGFLAACNDQVAFEEIISHIEHNVAGTPAESLSRSASETLERVNSADAAKLLRTSLQRPVPP